MSLIMNISRGYYAWDGDYIIYKKMKQTDNF